MSSKLYDCLVIGGGPAGLTAALTMARVRRSAIVFDSRSYRNAKSKKMHTVIGNDHVDPAEFRQSAKQQILDRYKTIEFRDSSITTAAKIELEAKDGGSGFEVKDQDGKAWRGKKVIMATGSKDIMPGIEGYEENWGKHIYTCPYCDGLEDAGKPVGILEWPSHIWQIYGLVSFSFSDKVTIFSNGDIPNDDLTQGALKMVLARGAQLEERRIKRLIDNGSGEHGGISVELEDGENVKLGCLFHHPKTESQADGLFQQLGIETTPLDGKLGIGGEVTLQMFGKTSVPGIFAAGDTGTPFKSVPQAIAAVNMAGTGVCSELMMEEGARALAAASK